MAVTRQRVATIVPMAPLTLDGSGDPGEQTITAQTSAPSGAPASQSGALQVAPIASIDGEDGEVARIWQMLLRLTNSTGDGSVNLTLWIYNRHSGEWVPASTDLELVKDPTSTAGAAVEIPGVLGASYAYAQISNIDGDEAAYFTLTPAN